MIKPGSPILQADSLPTELLRNPYLPWCLGNMTLCLKLFYSLSIQSCSSFCLPSLQSGFQINTPLKLHKKHMLCYFYYPNTSNHFAFLSLIFQVSGIFLVVCHSLTFLTSFVNFNWFWKLWINEGKKGWYSLLKVLILMLLLKWGAGGSLLPKEAWF